MAAFNPRRFSNPTTLREISPVRLQAFLTPYRPFLSARGLDMSASLFQEVDYEHLSRILMEPDTDTPKDLIKALSYINELAHPDGMDALLRAAESAQIPIADNSTPADVAIQVWMADRSLVERKHAEFSLTKPRSFVYCRTEQVVNPNLRSPSDDKRIALERSLDVWFGQHKRGMGTRVFPFDQGDLVWFQVRHGDPYACVPTMEGVQTSCVSYRPQKYDTLAYDPTIGEIRINARSKGEKELYRKKFGEHLYGSEEYFPKVSRAKCTLKPLRDHGREALFCRDVAGLEKITLTSLLVEYGGDQQFVKVLSANDVFLALEVMGEKMPVRPFLRRAVFEVKFTDSPTPRSVTITVPNTLQYTRDEDSVLIESWLLKRQFIRAPRESRHVAA